MLKQFADRLIDFAGMFTSSFVQLRAKLRFERLLHLIELIFRKQARAVRLLHQIVILALGKQDHHTVWRDHGKRSRSL
jgi:hypothetical protein